MGYIIETERLIVRSFKPEDWKDLYDYLSDEEVVAYEPYKPFTEDESIKEAARRSTDKAFFAVELKESGKVIGNLYFQKEDFDTWELGYVFNKSYQKRGYASESAEALIKYGIENLNVRRVIAMCNPENKPSWKLMERLKMRHEAHLLKNIYFNTDNNGNPIWQDTYMYGLLADEVK